MRYVVTLLALGLVAFQLYTAGVSPMPAIFQRSVHFALVLALLFLTVPVSRQARPAVRWMVDGPLVVLALVTGGYIYFGYDAVIERFGWWEPQDIWLGSALVLLTLEATRRVIGWPMTLIAAAFLAYAFLGPYMPGILAHKGYSLQRLVGQLYLTTEGIYGLPLGVAATFVFIFILFGALLEATGAGRFFIDLAYALAGRSRGGPAKASVIASAFMGSVSGSAIANVVTTGAFTIPLMKRLGYRPEEAAGVESAASTGGQIMPPIMGAGAFLIAEFTGVPYLEIVKLSLIPALLYFLTVYLFVDLIAAKRGMKGLPPEELPPLKRVLLEGWHFLLPVGVLVYYLIVGVSPMRVGFVAVLTVLAAALVRRSSRPRLAQIVAAFEKGARAAIPVSVATAAAGIVVGVVGLTGLGLKFSDLVLGFSGGIPLLALLLVALASLVLGMGLPVTASYIVLVVLAGPALEELGIALIVAHLVVFWFSQDSNVTPPVALAAYAAAGLAGTSPMRAAFKAWKFAKGLYLVPLLMVYAPGVLLMGSTPEILWDLARAALALFAFAVALEGYLFGEITWERGLLGLGGVLLFVPGRALDLVGVALVVLGVGASFLRARGRSLTGQSDA